MHPTARCTVLGQEPRLARETGDGRLVNFEAYVATVQWHGEEHEVAVLRSEGKPFVGMSLLDGSRLTIDVRIGGEVTIDEVSG